MRYESSVEVVAPVPEPFVGVPARSELFGRLDAVEVGLVAGIVASAHRLRLRPVAKMVTRFGNGGIYPFLALASALLIDDPLRVIAGSALSLGAAFAVYPALKRLLARSRPCDYDRSLRLEGPQPLDRYSCPSGHTMTATAYAVPIAVAVPETALLIGGFCLLVGWSRVALGHHYVSDVLLGSAVGAGVAVGALTLL